jgi:hypothetical protein
MATQLARRGIAITIAGIVVMFGLTSCANVSGSSGSSTSAGAADSAGSSTATATVPISALIVNNLLVTPAAYGDQPPSYAPPPTAVIPVVPIADVPRLYESNSPGHAPLGKYDVALAQLTRSLWPGSQPGQLVWLVINHDQHEVSNQANPPPGSTPIATPSQLGPPQDSVTVLDATTGKFVVLEQGQLFHAA